MKIRKYSVMAEEKTRPGRNGGTLKSGGAKNGGRPKNILTRLETALGREFKVAFSKSDKLAIMESMLEMSLNQLGQIVQDKDAPAFMVVMAQSIRGDIERKKMNTVDELFARFWGRPGKESEEAAEHKSDPLLELMKPK